MTTHVTQKNDVSFFSLYLVGLSRKSVLCWLGRFSVFLHPKGDGNRSDKLFVPLETVGLGKAYFIQFRRKPAFVIELSPSNFVALSAGCTPISIVLSPGKNKYKSSYTPDLWLVFCREQSTAEPPRPLESFVVSLEEDQIIIGYS